MKYTELNLVEFCDVTYSKAPVPGGGGVAALVASLGAALAGMVGNLTTGKKKYAAYEEDIQRLLGEAKRLQDDLLGMIDRDAENFLPLSKAYSLKAATEEEKASNALIMQQALKNAIVVPIEIVKVSYEAISLHDELSDKGSSLAISDVGVGVALLRSALLSGWLNVLINLNSITDEDFNRQVRSELTPLVEEGSVKCEAIYNKVVQILEKES
jgi:formiminotetrahydrofolate cyclodeaminase